MFMFFSVLTKVKCALLKEICSSEMYAYANNIDLFIFQAQFLIILIRVVMVMAMNCPLPPFFPKLFLFYMVTMIVFFSNFFVRAYHGPAKGKTDSKENGKGQ